jgi:regulator of sigma E protease
MDAILTGLIFIVILSILVLIHEAGHYFVARRAGIRVEEFGLGLPPKIWGKRIGDTEFTLNALPIGGFVRLYGETPDGVSVKSHPAEGSQAFSAKPLWARAAVLLAGVTANLLLGILLFTIVYTLGLPKYDAKAVIDAISPNSPAASAGVQKGESIVALNGQPFLEIDGGFSEAIKKAKGKDVKLTLEQTSGQQRDVQVTVREQAPAGEGLLGVSIKGEPYITGYERYPFYQAPLIGIKQAFTFAGAILTGLGAMATQVFQNGTPPADVAGPVGIASVLGQTRQLGLVPVLWFISILSINLAVVNVLPFPALDGGRLLFVIIEAVTGRKPNPNIERIVHTAGMAILLGLIILITFSDIQRFIMK